MLGTRAMEVRLAASLARANSSMSAVVNGPCSESNMTKSKPTWPIISTMVAEGNLIVKPTGFSPAAILVTTLFVRMGSLAGGVRVL